VEDTLNLLGHALRKAVGLAAQALGTSAEAVVEDAGLTLVGHSSLKAALDLDWGEPRARSRALGLVLEEVARWQRWLEQQQTLAAEQPPLQEVMETITQILTQDTEPDPGGGPGGRRLKQHVAPDRRISIEDKDIRHGRKSSAKTFNGFKEHFAVDLDSKVIREVVVRPANEPEHEAVELLADTLEQAPGLLQLDIDLAYMASPRIAQWAEQGVYIIARPWPQVGPLFTKQEFPLDFAAMQVTCPGGQTVPLVPGKDAQFPAAACDVCTLRAQCTKATFGQGRSLHIREDEQFQQKLRTKMKTQRGRASLRKRTAVEHTIAHQLAHQGRRARYKGLRKNQFDGRRHAAVSNLQIAAHYEEEHRLAS
jgi:Transposase DDE domain